MSIVPVIIAGGLGTRLWPLSCEETPKPFIEIFEGKSLFQKTMLRITPFLKEGGSPLIVTNKAFESLCRKQAESIGVTQFYSLIEPCMKNTTPAIISAAYFLAHKGDDPIMLVLPADHVITPFDKFVEYINQATKLAEKGHIVTFGIEPTGPKTCYGYIKRGESLGEGFSIDSFKEKPCKEKAESYIASKQHFWNSGIFMAKASVFLSEMLKYDPTNLNLIMSSIDQSFTEGQKVFLEAQYYDQIISNSIDYTIMEKTDKGAVVPANIDWSDIGTWDAYWDHQDKDDQANVLEGQVSAIDSQGCLFISKGVEIVGFGLEDIVAISNGNKVMITTRKKAPELKKIIESQEKEKVSKSV